MRKFIFPALALLIAGCSGVNDNVKPPTELQPIKATLSATEFWDANAGAGNDGQYLALEPYVSATHVVTVDVKGNLRAFDQNNGSRQWDVDLDLPIVAGVAGGDGLVFVGSEEGDLIASSVSDGSIKWKKRLGGQVIAISDADSGRLVVRLSGGKTVALDSQSGQEQWSFDREQPKLTLHGQGKPLTAHGGVALGMDDGSVVMLQLRSGAPIWESRLATGRGRTELDRLVDIDGSLVLSGEELFAASYQGKVAALDARSGRVLWSKEASSNTGVSVDRRAVYFTDEDGLVYALSRNSGIVLWTQEGLKHRRVTRPTIVEDAVVVGDYEGYLHWLDIRTGKFVQRKRAASEGILAAPKLYRDRVIVLSDDGNLSSWSATAVR